MKRRISVLLSLALITIGQPAEAGQVTYSGRVTGTDGKPVVGIEVAMHWFGSSQGMSPLAGIKTDAEGRFTFILEGYDGPISLMAITKDSKLGGRKLVDSKKKTDAIEIKLESLVRVHGGFKCPVPDHPVQISNVFAVDYTGGKGAAEDAAGVAQSQFFNIDSNLKPNAKPQPPTFDFRLPPGEYVFQFTEPTEPIEHESVNRTVMVKADQPGLDLDLGAVELQPSRQAQGYGKEAPLLRIKDARGLAKGVKLADFKGKWVILEFWSYNCGPCIARGLPELVDFLDEHAVDRDKFVILAVHDDSVPDFAELDKQLVSTIKDLWAGKPLPFPIVLDDEGKTAKAYGIEAVPSMVLIDPEGKLVRADLSTLEAALTPIPMDRRVARMLDRQVDGGIGPEGSPLEEVLKSLMESARFLITIDEGSGVNPKTLVPLTMTGQISLRSWFDLTLEPLGLEAVADDKGLIVKKANPDHRSDPALSKPQRDCAVRIAAKLEAKTRFDFSNASLAEVADHFETETEENFVIDPRDRLAGRLDPELMVSGKVEDMPLKDALKALLGPIGVEAVIRDEVVILRRARP